MIQNKVFKIDLFAALQRMENMKTKLPLILLIVLLFSSVNPTSGVTRVAGASAAPQALLSSGAITLPRSGQTVSYYAGDDGALQTGAAWPAARFNDPGDGSVTDALTGLMWVKDFNLMLTRDPAFDTDGAVDGAVLWMRALDYAAKLNSEAYLGYTDWHLPNVIELESLLDTSGANPSLPAGHPFANVRPLYWSSTTYGQGNPMAWGVLFSDLTPYKSGCVDALGWKRRFISGFDQYVAIVRDSGVSGTTSLPRSGQTRSYYPGDDGDLQKGTIWPTPRFVDHGDGTVSDRLTGLMWTQNAQQGGSSLAWTAALDYVAGMNAGSRPNYGLSGWRMPNLIEARSLLDLGRPVGNPELSEGHPFINIGYLWTSTTTAFNPSQAWAVSTTQGRVWNYNKTTGFNLWAVRDDPALLAGNAIRGQATLDGLPLAGVKLTLSGPLSGLTVTDANGEYSFTHLPDGAYTLTAQKLYHGFSPSSLAATLTGSDQTSQDFTAFATRAFGWSDISAPLLRYATDFSDVEFIGEEGWLASSMFNEIYHTTDGGQTWEIQTIEAGYVVNGIAMRSLSEGYAIAQNGSSGRIFRTTDSGAQWTSLGSTGTVPRAIDCPPSGSSCFLVGYSGKFIKVTGAILTPYLTSGSSNLGTELDFVSFPLDDTAGWWGGGSIIRRFENDQLIADQAYAPEGWNALASVDKTHAWSVGDLKDFSGGASASIAFTQDGKNWIGQNNNLTHSLSDVIFFDWYEGWAVGGGGTIIHTTNGGGNGSVSGWNIEAAGLTNNELRSISAVDRTTLYAAGNEITLLKYQRIAANVQQHTIYLPLLRK